MQWKEVITVVRGANCSHLRSDDRGAAWRSHSRDWLHGRLR